MASKIIKNIKTLPLAELQRVLNPVIGNYAGYALPMQFGYNKTSDVIRNIRQGKPVIFDVSHMGVIRFKNNDLEKSHRLLEKVFPINTNLLKENKSKLTVLLNNKGHVQDDLIISNINDKSHRLVVNAATKHDIYNILQMYNKEKIDISLENEIILAVQGHESQVLLETILNVNLDNLKFNDNISAKLAGNHKSIEISRTGYTGEDGFEIYCDIDAGKFIYQKLLDLKNEIHFGGLIERDLLRLEAGFCLSGNEFGNDKNILFSELNMDFLIGKRRREDKAFLGGDKLIDSNRIRTGFFSEKPIKDGDIIYQAGKCVGQISSFNKSFSLNKFISMGYLDKNSKNEIYVKRRDKIIYLQPIDLPFVPLNFKI
ncbi:Aminomethyltransferase folate-binding domain [seawater metagenome]|uniref:Aminomethyltransferase folate-binding domain n=1 Tax=seawater metagenome TaxID=1561972 RepID=A0A5E8CHH6_9ZZZZ